MQKKFILSSLTLLMSLNTCIYADNDLDKLLNMSLEELLEVEIESSTHTKEDIFSVPSSITVFTYDQIQKMSVNTLEELMNYVPGFQTSRSNFFTNLKVNSTRGKFTSLGQRDILVIYDGQRLNNILTGGALEFNALMSLENIEKIEFIKGPGSALYGSNAFVGVVNIYSKKDLNNIGMRFKENYANAYINASYSDEDIKISSFIKGIVDDGENYGTILDDNNILFKANDKNDGSEAYVTAKYKDFQVQARYIRRDTKGWYALDSTASNSNSKIHQEFIRVSYSFNKIEDYESKISIGLIQSVAEINYAPNTNYLKSEDNSIDVNWMNSYTVNKNNSFQFGAEYRHPKLKKSEVNAYKLTELGSRDIYGLYAQYQVNIEEVSFTIGGRYDDYSDFGDTFNPRVALVYRASEDTSFKLLYGSAFRAPTFTELSSTAIIKGNPNLQPEEIDTYEAIWIQKLGNNSLNLSYYYSVIDNVIVDVSKNGRNTRENLGKEKYSGIEAELVSEFFHRDLQTRLGVSHMLNTDQDAKITPKTTLSAIGNYKYNKFNFNVNSFYHSSSHDSTDSLKSKKLDDYIIVNTKIIYLFKPNLELFFEMENIFDESYTTPAITATKNFDIENRGRLSYLGLEYSF